PPPPGDAPLPAPPPPPAAQPPATSPGLPPPAAPAPPTGYAGLCAATKHYLKASPGVATSLCSKLSAAEAAGRRNNPNARTGELAAFKNEVAAQSGKTLTPAQATALLQAAD